MTLLFQNRELGVTRIRDALGMTDGNLASHLERLEGAGYVRTGRVLAGLTFEVHATITEEGSAAFRAYLAQLRALLPDEAGQEPPVGPSGG